MPLPTTDQAWPPPDLAPVYDTYKQWDAWYVGDPEGLRAYYGSGTTPASADRTGIIGALTRFFWGRPRSANSSEDKRIHVPVAADLAMTSADLLLGEQVDFTCEDKKAQERLQKIADDGMYATLVEAAEVAAALAGVYLRVVWAKALSDRPWLSAVHPDAAVPEWQWGKLAAVTFWRVVDKRDGKVVRLLERHEPGRIEYGLYEGDKARLGKQIPLTSLPETHSLPASGIVETGVPKRLTAVYVPNVRPSRRWRNNPAAAPLGRSDLDGIEHLMDALDEVMSSWMRDVRHGKARLIVPDHMLESKGPGKGSMFDMDREVWQGVQMDPSQKLGGAAGVQAEQFEIRVEQHRDTAIGLLEEILRTAGYSPATYGMQGEVAITATEVAAKTRRSLMTRDRKIRYWRPELAYILEVLLAVDAAQLGGGTPEGTEVAVHFPDGVSEDTATLAQTSNLLRQAEAASTQTLVTMLHPDWDEPQIAAEVALIAGERALAQPDTFNGDFGQGDQDGGGSDTGEE